MVIIPLQPLRLLPLPPLNNPLSSIILSGSSRLLSHETLSISDALTLSLLHDLKTDKSMNEL